VWVLVAQTDVETYFIRHFMSRDQPPVSNVNITDVNTGKTTHNHAYLVKNKTINCLHGISSALSKYMYTNMKTVLTHCMLGYK